MYKTLFISLSAGLVIGFYEFSLLTHPWYIAIPTAIVQTVLSDFLIAAGMMYYTLYRAERKALERQENYKL